MEDAAAAIQQTVERVDHVRRAHLRAKIEEQVDLVRDVVHQEELLLVGAFEKNDVGAGPLKQFLPKSLRQTIAAWLGERQNGELGRADMVVEQLAVISPDRGDKYQDLAHEYVDKRDQQQPA